LRPSKRPGTKTKALWRLVRIFEDHWGRVDNE
jgi:hypothetical protein